MSDSYTTKQEKFEMLHKIVVDKDERKNVRNFLVSRPDWNNGERATMRINIQKASRLISFGFTIIQAIDQTPRRRRKKPEKLPKQLL